MCLFLNINVIYLTGKYGRVSQKIGRGRLHTWTAYGLAFTEMLRTEIRC